MFNDGGVLPGIMGGPREPPAPTLQQRVCLVPELGRDTHKLPESFQLGSDYSEEHVDIDTGEIQSTKGSRTLPHTSLCRPHTWGSQGLPVRDSGAESTEARYQVPASESPGLFLAHQ